MKTIIRILKFAKQWRVHLIIATISMLCVTGLNLLSPALVRKLFGVIGDENAVDPQKSIIIIALILLGTYVLRLIFQFLNSYFSHIAAWRSVAKLRGRLYSHLQTLSMKYYSDKQTGQLMSRVIEDTANFEMLIAHALPDLITSFLVFFGVLTIIFFINWKLALLTCIPIPFIFLSATLLKRIRRHFAQRQKVSAELNGLLQDNFSGIREIQVFNRENKEFERVYEKANTHATMTLKGLFWVAILHPSMNFLTGLGTFIIILFGGLFALSGTTVGMAVSDITVFLLYLGLLYAPVATLSRVLEDIQTALVSGKRVVEILDTKSDVADKEGALVMPRVQGDIEFCNVSFDYTSDIAVLKNISFKVERGKMVALVGATGAGKTTITSLLARFYDPVSGQIKIDGMDTADYTLASLRSNLSIVLQDVFLFNGTIAENIAYSKEGELSFDEIVNAAKTACIHDFIESLPEKYNTVIGERGFRLSGGQKQRLSIARAVLRDAPILILDEATSAVDNETESQIQEAINRLMGKSTIIVIAHRLSTIEKADEILVLSEGEIIERGTHKQLLQAGGHYAKMQKSS